MERAADALVSVFSALIEGGKPIPPPSDAQGRPKVSIGPLYQTAGPLTAFVTPAQAGVQAGRAESRGVGLDARFRGHDGGTVNGLAAWYK
jgi:hypothetical protein